jgi:hypothetical protein
VNVVRRKPIENLFGVRNAAARDILAYWLAVILAVGTIAGIYWLLRTKRGLALAAVRDNIEAAKSVGVDAGRMKWTVFLVSAFGTGLAGATDLYAEGADLTGCGILVQDWTAYVIFIVVIGGIGTIEGPILGVLVFFILQSLLADYGSWYLMALGIIGIVIMLFAPRGLWGLISDRTGIRTVSRAPAPDRRSPRQLTRPTEGGIDPMADIQTDVLIIGTGPAGSARRRCCRPTASRTWRSTATAGLPTRRARTSPTSAPWRCCAISARRSRTRPTCSPHQDLMGENVFCESLAGEEIGRMKSWGNHPLSKAEHLLSSPTMMNDLPQTFMEPLLFKTACSRGTQARMSTEYLQP